jgi:hypothetical protein
MPDSGFLVGVAIGASAVLVLGTLGTRLVSGTESTTGLDRYDTVTVDGHRALAPDVVAGRLQSLYHPLPWVGAKAEVSCPAGLRAVTGATLTCAGEKEDGTTVDVPIRVVGATDTHITWTFER